MSLQEKFVKLREAVPAITQRQHSEGVKYKFAKIFDVYELLTPAMNCRDRRRPDLFRISRKGSI